MKNIGIINEHNFSKEKIKKLPIHKKVRGFIYKDKNTLICIEEDGYGVKQLLKLPGGSIEKKESVLKAIRREVLEETGYTIYNIKRIGSVQNIRRDHIVDTTYYTAKIKGKNKGLKLTTTEKERGTKIIEINTKIALKRIKDEYIKAHNDSSMRDLLVFYELNI